MSNHTPKPWEFQREVQMVAEATGTFRPIAKLFRSGVWTRETCNANGRLVTAAPDMLAALEAVRWAIEDGTLVDKDRDPEGNDIHSIVDSAITKAKQEDVTHV